MATTIPRALLSHTPREAEGVIHDTKSIEEVGGGFGSRR